jgi:hypothetical protein
VDAARCVAIEGLSVTGGRNGIAVVYGAGITIRTATIQNAGV